MYHREYHSIAGRLKELHEMPFVSHADFWRAAHEFNERRVEAGRIVARRLEVSENHGQLVEDVLFDWENRRLYGYSSNATMDIWRPRHISVDEDIGELMRVATMHRQIPPLAEATWTNIVHALFAEDGLQLYPVLRRFAISPVPDLSLLKHKFDTTEHAELRERLSGCILEAFQS